MTHLYPLKPDCWLVTNSNPAGVVGHPQPGPCQIDAEPSLGTVGQAVAVPRLPVRDVSALQISSEREVIGCKYGDLKTSKMKGAVTIDGEGGDVETDLAPDRPPHPGRVVLDTGLAGVSGPVVGTTLGVYQPQSKHLAVVLRLAGGQSEELPGGGALHVVAVDCDVPTAQQDRELSVLSSSQTLPAQCQDFTEQHSHHLLDLLTAPVSTLSPLTLSLPPRPQLGPVLSLAAPPADPPAGGVHTKHLPSLSASGPALPPVTL